jgi:ABC-type transporter Mla subunit MlaD
MSNPDLARQNFQRDAADKKRGPESASEWASKTAKEAVASASSLAGEAADKAKQAVSETAANVSGEMKELLNRQLGRGAETVGYVARSTRRAADDLESDSPQLAGLVRSLASQVDGYADSLRDQSVDQLWKSAADFTRRQPALVFGLAALAGFFALRTVKSSPAISAPSIQPSHPRAGQSHGS